MIVIKNVPGWGIRNRNFSGDPKKDKFANDARQFSLCLTDDFSNELEQIKAAGIRVKEWFDSERNSMNYYIQVKVSKDVNIVIKTDSEITKITDLATVDDLRIDNATVVINPYNWEMGTRSGISAYLNELWITQNKSIADEAYSEWMLS